MLFPRLKEKAKEKQKKNIQNHQSFLLAQNQRLSQLRSGRSSYFKNTKRESKWELG